MIFVREPGFGFGNVWTMDNLFGQIRKIKGYKSKYYGVSGKNVLKLAFI